MMYVTENPSGDAFQRSTLCQHFKAVSVILLAEHVHLNYLWKENISKLLNNVHLIFFVIYTKDISLSESHVKFDKSQADFKSTAFFTFLHRKPLKLSVMTPAIVSLLSAILPKLNT